jgi:RNA polymerase sigma-70 factor (ECF subfamily)
MLDWNVVRVDERVEYPDDEGSVRAFQSGDRRAFDALARAYRPGSRDLLSIYRKPGRRRGSVQEVLLRAYRGLETFRGEASFRTWLFRITVNACLNWVAARRRSEVLTDDFSDLPEPGPSVVERLVRGQAADRVRRAVSQLPDRQRMTVLLRVYEELSHKEISGDRELSGGNGRVNFSSRKNLQRLAEK